jgi:transcriptional regulator PpsR
VSDKPDLALSYSVIQLHSARGDSDTAHAVAFGRDLRSQAALQQRLVTAQLSMERDYWRLRQVETRYRLLFQMASEPVLILEGSIDKLEEANPAAYELFGDKSRTPGWTLAASLDAASHNALRDMLDRLRASGKADPCEVRLIEGAQDLVVTASQFRQENTLHFLLRFTRPQDSVAPSLARGKQRLLQVMEAAPDALVVTDMEGRVLSANRAFLDMGQLGTEDQARGEVLDKWLGRTGVDFRVLLTNLRQHGTVRLFATQMRGEFGSTSEVEISAVAVNSGPQRCLGFTIRDMGRRLTADGRSSRELPRSASQMTELVGRLPLKDIVRETTDLIEQLCIEAALELTGDNRASAAEMLGLSRQSLYIKLRRFGILEGVGEDTH